MEKKSKNVGVEEPKKLSYEELEKLCNQLRGSNAEIFRHLQSAEETISNFNEIGMLLEVLGKAEFFTEPFVSRCASKIQDIISKALDMSEKQEDKAN